MGRVGHVATRLWLSRCAEGRPREWRGRMGGGRCLRRSAMVAVKTKPGIVPEKNPFMVEFFGYSAPLLWNPPPRARHRLNRIRPLPRGDYPNSRAVCHHKGQRLHPDRSCALHQGGSVEVAMAVAVELYDWATGSNMLSSC